MFARDIFVVFGVLLFKLPGSEASIGYFWHVTDFHYDPTYSTSHWSCKAAQQPEVPAGIYGNMWCDSPWILVESSIQAMKDIEPDVDFLLWTGDTIPHADDSKLSDGFNLAIQTNISRALKDSFPRQPIYATFGNHDYHPADQFPSNTTQLYQDIYKLWQDWISGADQKQTFLKGGYYTAKTSFGLRIIGLNTILYYTPNKAVSEQGDISGQFKWLEDTLTAARRNNERVLVTAHIQPGVSMSASLNFYPKQHAVLVDIFRRFADVIEAMHFGHEHADGFKILSNDAGLDIPIFYAPSVTPIRFGPVHNPAIRLVKYDRATKKHLDFAQYYMDLATANKLQKAEWKLEYNFTDSYSVADLSATSLKSIANRIKDPESSEFDKFVTYYYVSAPINQREACDADCHATTYCGLAEFSMNEFDTCVSKLVSGAETICSMSIVVILMSIWLTAYFLSQ